MRFEVLRIALSALRANLLRSLLTMLGIVIGVAAVIAMIAIGDGAQQSVRDRIGRLGTTLLQIDAARATQGGVQQATFKRMTIADVVAIEERAPHVLAVQPAQDKPLQIVWRNMASGQEQKARAGVRTTPYSLPSPLATKPRISASACEARVME